MFSKQENKETNRINFIFCRIVLTRNLVPRVLSPLTTTHHPPPHIPPNEFGLPVFVFKNCIVYFYISIIYFNFNILHTFFFLQQISSPDGKYIVM